MTQLLLSLSRCARSPDEADAMFVDAAAELLAVCLLRDVDRVRAAALPSSRERALSSATVARVREFVEANLDRALRVVELATVAGMSVYHFSRAFRLATGETPHAFALRLRIERAADLLEHGELGLAEIALATGFASQSHFTSQFKHARWISPGAFRRRYRSR